MKILILQLARLGDIYQTWPVLRALKRQDPQAQIHFLTRAKFAAAAPGRDVVDRHWVLDTRSVLEPLIDEKPDLNAALGSLGSIIGELKAEAFDKVINLSFSPFSSFLVKEIASADCEVKGYTRFDDGSLCIPDDGSAYFYAQTGPGRANRLHVTDLFAFVSDVELTDADWSVGQESARDAGSIVIHIGASDPGKTLSWSKWMQVVKGLTTGQTGEVVLVGAPNERELADQICAAAFERAPKNRVGQTSLDELFDIVRNARLLIGGDSAPIHIAGLTATPVLNISFPMVSFWETGPRSPHSRIMPIAGEDQISADEIVREALGLLARKSTVYPVVRVSGPTIPYVELRPQPRAFEWELLKAIYMSADFPNPPSELFTLGLERLKDVTVLGREQLATLKVNSANSTAALILNRASEIIDRVQEMIPELSPIVGWFKTELSRIGPMPVAELVDATDSVYRRLGEVIALYLPDGDPKEGHHDDVNVG